MRRAVIREVMSAAEDPSPVLWTSESRTPVGVNGGNLESDFNVRGRPNASNYNCNTSHQKGVAFLASAVETCAHLGALRIEIVVPNNRYVHASREDGLDMGIAFNFYR